VARNKDTPRVQNPPQGDGHFEHSREMAAKKPEAVRAGCVFAKSCKLPDAIIDYSNPFGMVPTRLFTVINGR